MKRKSPPGVTLTACLLEISTWKIILFSKNRVQTVASHEVRKVEHVRTWREQIFMDVVVRCSFLCLLISTNILFYWVCLRLLCGTSRLKLTRCGMTRHCSSKLLYFSFHVILGTFKRNHGSYCRTNNSRKAVRTWLTHIVNHFWD